MINATRSRKKIGRIGGFQPVSLIDWQGMVSSVVFLSGCNWRCPFCHNRYLCGIRSDICEDDVMNHLNDRKRFLGGVVLGGGEPLFNPDVIHFVKKIRSIGYKIKVDTNGSFPNILKILIDNKYIDYVAMDIKTRLTDYKYGKATGVSGQVGKIKKSIMILSSSNIDHEFRTTIVPEIVSIKDIIANLKHIPAGAKYAIQQYSNANVNDEHFKNVSPYNEFVLLELVEMLNKRGVKSWLRI